MFGFFFVNSISYVEAKSNDVIRFQKEAEGEKEDEEQNTTSGGSGCASYVGDEKEQCENDRKATLKSADFVTKAIMSLDNTIAEMEKNLDYIKNFENSSSTAIAYGISLADPETIVMWIINIFTGLLEKLGLVISLIVMVLYNVASSSFIQTVVRSVFDSLESVLFVWNDPNAYVYKLITAFGLVGLVYRLLQNKKQIITIGTVMNMFVQVLLSCVLIVFIGQYGKPLITNVENMMQTSLTESFSLQEDKNTPLEIQTKEMLFENLQMKSFILRHFGVTETSQIKKIDGVKNEDRVSTLLNDPSIDNAKIERKIYKSEDVSYNFVSCLKILGLSFMFLVHRILLGIVFGVGALLLNILTLAKEILLGVSIFGVIFTLIKRDKSTLSWFVNRLQWSILCILANSFYAIFLYVISYLIGQATNDGGIILMIPIDLAIFFGGKYAIKKMPEWIEKILSDFNLEGQSAFQVAKGFFTGDFSPKDISDNRKSNNEKGGDASSDDIHEEKADDSNVTDNMNHIDDEDLVDKTDEDMEEDGDIKVEELENGENKEVTVDDLNASDESPDSMENNLSEDAEEMEDEEESNVGDIDTTDEDLKEFHEESKKEETDPVNDSWDDLLPLENDDSLRVKDSAMEDSFFDETNDMEISENEDIEDIEDLENDIHEETN